jgi:hypothetical protein
MVIRFVNNAISAERSMKNGMIWLLMTLSAVIVAGCRTEVETTEDSHKVEVAVPKVEVGDAPVDLDPKTDKDVDVDTPSPGDT